MRWHSAGTRCTEQNVFKYIHVIYEHKVLPCKVRKYSNVGLEEKPFLNIHRGWTAPKVKVWTRNEVIVRDFSATHV